VPGGNPERACDGGRGVWGKKRKKWYVVREGGEMFLNLKRGGGDSLQKREWEEAKTRTTERKKRGFRSQARKRNDV